MAKYQVTGRMASFAAGFILGLTAEQAARRAGALEDTGGGKFRVLTPVEFKAGEVVEVLHGDVGKADMLLLAEAGAGQPLKRRRRRARDQATLILDQAQPDGAGDLPIDDPDDDDLDDDDDGDPDPAGGGADPEADRA